MRHWQQYSVEEQLQLLDISSAKTSIARISVEKDWWVSMVLKALTLTQYAHLMSFKGGTSLTKGWSLINRFSEDIDVALRRDERFNIDGISNTQLAKVRRKARHYVIRELPIELEEILTKLGISGFSIEPEEYKLYDGARKELRADTHPSVLYVNYESILPETSEYVKTRVKIEISCLSMDEPVSDICFKSLIGDAVPMAEDMTFNFNTVHPTRTFLEKIFLLHEEFQKEKPRCYRMSRHLYDLEKIMDSSFGLQALTDKELFEMIAKHRSIYNRLPHVDYSKHVPECISIIPPTSVRKEWEDDYKKMIFNFIYDDKKNTFELLLQRIQELEKRIHSM